MQQTKGLEFDAVIVVDPADCWRSPSRGAGDLYVALTRATRRLGVVTVGPLPAYSLACPSLADGVGE